MSQNQGLLEQTTEQQDTENLFTKTPLLPESGDTRVALWRDSLPGVATGTPLLVIDCLVVVIALLSGFAVSSVLSPDTQYGLQRFSRQLLAHAAMAPIVFSALGLYPGVGLNPIVEFRLSIIAATVITAILTVANSSFGTLMPFEILWLGTSWMFALALLPMARVFARQVLSWFDWWGQPVLVVGNGHRAASVFDSLRVNRSLGMRPIGIVGNPGDFKGARMSRRQSEAFLATFDDLAVVVRDRCVSNAVLITHGMSHQVVDVVSSYVPNLAILPDVSDVPSLWTRAYDCDGQMAFHMKERLLLPGARLAKRTCDLVITFFVIVAMAPLIFLFGLLIKISSPGPVFYKQRRIGKYGRIFWLWKFRTMVANADEALASHLESDPKLRAEWERDHKLRHDPRVTMIGRFLRKTSLDELPQIWNVLVGEMSLVGPRPIVEGGEGRPYLEEHPEAFARYKKVVPGITGLWQISGRNHTTYAERVAYDSYYVRNWSPWFDAYILVRTVWVVVTCQGAY